MKLVGIVSTAALSLLLGIAVPAYTQQEQHDQQEEQKAKPAQEEKKAQPEKPAKQEEKNARPEKSTNQEEKNVHQQDRNSKPEEKSAQQERNTNQEQKNAQQEKNTNREEKNAQQRTSEARPGEQAQRVGGGRIPDDRFKANFGREHTFRVSQDDYSSRRFQYGGYWFGFAGAWPSNWLYEQDVFVIDIDGVYYLCNPMYPGVNIALEFTE